MARTQIAADAFPYSNGNLSAVSGGNWGDLSTGGGWGFVYVAGNAISSAIYGANSPAARWTGAGAFEEDQYAALDINLAGATGAGADVVAGVVCRASADQDATRDYYFVYVEDSWPNDTRVLRIGKIINGTYTWNTTWAWTAETFSAAGGATGRTVSTGNQGRFVYAPTIKSHIWVTLATNRAQAYRPAGS